MLSFSPIKGDVDEQSRIIIEKMETERRKKALETKQKLKEKEEELQNMKKKIDALLARNQILEKHYKEYKSKFEMIIKKTERDDKYIQALQTELNNQRKQVRELEKEMQKNTRALNIPESDLEIQVKDMKRELRNKDELIQSLKQELHSTSKKALETMEASLKSKSC